MSPFLDRSHGAERCVVEQIEDYCRRPGVEVHVYAQAIRDLEVVRYAGVNQPGGRPIWHRIPALAGPHLFNYLWWFFANFGARWFDRTFRSLNYDVVFSPGINCWDADAIVTHVVFHEFFRHVRQSLRLGSAPLRSWPATIHRIIYYRVIMLLENCIYPSPRICLAAVSNLTARELSQTAKRTDITVIPNAVDSTKFNPEARLGRRRESRAAFRFADSDFVLLLLGNGWKNKGLTMVLEALGTLGQLPLRLLVVGRDDQAPFQVQIGRLQLERRVTFAEPSHDVLQFYAAADAYASPSLHDSFAMPPLEAMACGLPVVTSARNGGSQVITDGVDGFVLNDPEDAARFAELIRRLCERPDLCREVGARAATTAKSYTWERNASETWAFLLSALRRKDAQ